jgi:hypothetical protein
MASEEAPPLLVRERDELGTVAMLLHEGRRVVAFLVCKAELRPAALGYLRERSGVAVPDPILLDDPGQTLDVLTEAEGRAPNEVLSLAIDKGPDEVLRTLNWHREKLRRGASVLIWIDGIDGLRALRATSPDAYSFRDITVIVQGADPVLVKPLEEEPLDLSLARLHYIAASSPRDRAAAAVVLADALRLYGSVDERRAVALDALAQIPRDVNPDEEARLMRVGLYATLTDRADGQIAQAWRWANSGLSELDSSLSAEGRLGRILLLTKMPSPLGADHRTIGLALAEIQPMVDRPDVQFHVLFRAATGWTIRGNLCEASRLLRISLATPELSIHNKAVTIMHQGAVNCDAGRLAIAEERYRASSVLLMTDVINHSSLVRERATCARLKGEHESARRMLEGIRTNFGHDSTVQFRVTGALAELRILDEGDVVRGLAELRALMHESAAAFRDQYLYDACSSYVACLRAAQEADRIAPSDLADADAELEIAEDVALSIARDDPPWYTVLFPGLRAEILALRPDRLTEAIGVARSAVERARAVWTDAVPMHARALVDHLVRAGHFEEARAELARAEAEAEAQCHLRELARLRALAVAVLVRTAAPAADIDVKMASLRVTLDETCAPRITADTLLELALLLPPEPSRPDPLDLLDEAHALFLDMPIVAKEARCLEVMGDVLVARGDAAAARRRYLAANGIYERYALGLRLPLLTSKLDRLGEP